MIGEDSSEGDRVLSKGWPIKYQVAYTKSCELSSSLLGSPCQVTS